MDLMSASMDTWLLLVAVAILIGLDKSFLPGAGVLGIGFLAAVIPARQASGITLALIIVADWAAIWAYRKDVDWRALLRLLPNIVVGVVLGSGFLLVADNAATKRTIGVLIVAFVLINIAVMARNRHRRATPATAPTTPAAAPTTADHTADLTAGDDGQGGRGSAGEGATAGGTTTGTGTRRRVSPKSLLFGVLAGFATMVANAAGPITSLYFLSEGFAVVRFLGTTAWLFLILNLIKLPFSLSLGMLTGSDLRPVAIMVPVIVATVLVGRQLARRVDRRVFTTLVLILSAVAGVILLV
ncbi:sulfite exporter TauE/SafE family protein [Acidipropionibacterium jensenii]|uniref:Probable membrane transporter protein n=1 Tax=Acidipropionibacterium jensenii TaxID=1749 RepID=A0A448NVR1_9ACTN|nr:sulfite exporter TauE/SafE family protein [Acidipropionibacterium jensenii]MDN5976270.1 sulfite exporter TauE/SafE family protein [Acidipropionibacterium jensenii]MDN5995337.1 sulfite exporter TauE/SafE family protein [Acidipropionibacterium jensenii]MDN6479621.1 sulfite exporter TauE/SafE family protein [Acidipropionibacterium jensenii]MDN6591164.1 sulfite exporter TauE/SafE family protein [Acidipropionibacterium jensenii]MDN6624878.1 sulfite exporter TauE/SafE family protein [Acidipropion